MEVLSAMEAVETDEEDRPHEEIKICRTSVFVDPFKEAEEEVRVLVPFLPLFTVEHFHRFLRRRRRRRGKEQLQESNPAPVDW